MIQSLKTIALSFSVAALSSNVVINLIVGGLLSELWGMINSLQIIMHTLCDTHRWHHGLVCEPSSRSGYDSKFWKPRILITICSKKSRIDRNDFYPLLDFADILFYVLSHFSMLWKTNHLLLKVFKFLSAPLDWSGLH